MSTQAPTLVDRPGRHSAELPTAVSQTPGKRHRLGEVRRVRWFMRIVVVGIIAGIPANMFLEGDPTMRLVVKVAAVVTAAVYVAYDLYLRSPERYGPVGLVVVNIPGIATLTLWTLYFGVAAQVLVVCAVAAAGMVANLRVAVALFLLIVLPQAATVLALGYGAFEFEQLYAMSSFGPGDGWYLVMSGAAVFSLTFVAVRMGVGIMRRSVEELEDALRQVNQREALVQEAHLELDQQLAAGAHGRFSGQTVGSWTLGEVIGRGGMGEVYAAAHARDTQRAGAVKLLREDYQDEPDRLARFLREAEATAKLDSPHVVKIYEVGDGSSGPPFIAMERLYGPDLAVYLRKHRTLLIDEVIEILEQAADVLELARAADIVHRDLKPQNLCLAAEESQPRVWKILDFGISKLAGSAGTLTQGNAIGTPGYMAPEQASGQAVDHRADVFALSVLAYRALTGQPPFTGDGAAAVLFDVVYRQPKRPGALANLTSDVDAVLMLGLAKYADDRLGTAAELAKYMKQAAQGKLARKIRERAKRLGAAYPWGANIHPDR